MNINERVDKIEHKLNMLVDGMNRGVGTAIAETEKAKTGEQANVAAVRGLKAIKAQIEKIKNLTT